MKVEKLRQINRTNTPEEKARLKDEFMLNLNGHEISWNKLLDMADQDGDFICTQCGNIFASSYKYCADLLEWYGEFEVVEVTVRIDDDKLTLYTCPSCLGVDNLYSAPQDGGRR